MPQNIMRALCAVIRPDHLKFASYGPDLGCYGGHLSVLQLISSHVIEKIQEIGEKLRAELRRVVGFYQILAGNVITCLEPLLNCQCHNFQVQA